jgi:hypothetical protein
MGHGNAQTNRTLSGVVPTKVPLDHPEPAQQRKRNLRRIQRCGDWTSSSRARSSTIMALEWRRRQFTWVPR